MPESISEGCGENGNGKAGRDEGDRASKAEQRREAAQRRAGLKPLQKRIKETETLMERLQKRIQAIETELADPALYEKNPARATELAKERAALSNRLGEHEEDWLALSQDYERAMTG